MSCMFIVDVSGDYSRRQLLAKLFCFCLVTLDVSVYKNPSSSYTKTFAFPLPLYKLRNV